jgi:hypothetical protein
MRRIHPNVLRFILIGGVLLLVLLGSGAGVVSFLLLRAGYSFLVWGLFPPLTLLLVAVILGGILLRGAGDGSRPHGGPNRGEDNGV